jgi:glutathione S-transferase
MGIDLYYMPLSAPCRAIILTAKAIGVDLNLKPTSIPDGETRTPEFIKVCGDMFLD